MQSAGPTFGLALTQEDKEVLCIGASASPTQDASPQRLPLPIHPPRPSSRPPPEGTPSFKSASQRFPDPTDYTLAPPEYPNLDVQAEFAPGDVSTLHSLQKLQWLRQQERRTQARQGIEQNPLPNTNQGMIRTPLLAPLRRAAPNELRMRELFDIFMRTRHQDPGPGTHDGKWTAIMKNDRTDHKRPHIHGVDGPRLLKEGEKTTRALEMEKTIYQESAGPPSSKYNPLPAALKCTKRREDLSSVVRYREPETVKVVSKSKSILDGRNWRDPSLPAAGEKPMSTFGPPGRPPSAVLGRGDILHEQTVTADILDSMRFKDATLADSSGNSRGSGSGIVSLDMLVSGRPMTPSSPASRSRSVSARGQSRSGNPDDKYTYQIERAASLARSSQAPSPQPSTDEIHITSPEMRSWALEAATPAREWTPSSGSSAPLSYQFEPVSRLSEKPEHPPTVPVVVPPVPVLRKSIAGAAPSEWNWEGMVVKDKAGLFSAQHGGAFVPMHRSWNRYAEQEKDTFLGKIGSIKDQRAYKAGTSMAAQTTGWTPPDWVKDLAATSTDLFPWKPRKIDDDEMSILGGIPDIKESVDGDKPDRQSADQEKMDEGQSDAVPQGRGSLPIPSDPDVAPSITEIVRHETAATMADHVVEVHHKQLEWQIRSHTIDSSFENVGSPWPGGKGLPARLSMADPLRYQPLPKKRIMREGLW